MPGAPPVQANTSGGTGGSTTNSQNFTVPVTAGNLLVLYIFDTTGAASIINSVAWIGTNSGTLTLTPGGPVTGGGRKMWCFTAIITASGATGVLVTFNASINSVVAFAEYSGMATSSPIDKEISATGSGTAISSGSITTTNANDTLVGGIFVTTSGGGTLTAGSGFTLRVNNGSTSHRGVEDQNVTAVGSYAATATYSSSQTWIAHLLCLKSATGTPVVATPTVDNPAGTYPGSVTVTISDATPGATMCYRTDGVDPTAATPGTCSAGSTTYSTPVTLNASATLKVLGTLAGSTNSGILTQAYVVRGAASFYVSAAGSDAATGADAAHPWAHAPGMTGATGVAASATLLPGDSVLFNKGDSWLNTTWTLPAGGATGNPITASAYGSGAKPIISGPVNQPAITVTAANRGFWTVDGLDLKASGIVSGINVPATIYHNYWAADLLAVPNWIIQNCNSNASFYLSGPNTTVRNNVFDGASNSNPPFGAIILRGQLNTFGIVESNTVSNFKDRGIWINRGANNVTVRYNNVHHIFTGSDNEGMGVNLDGFEIPVTDGQTYGNWIHDCDGMGITHENGTRSKAYFNLIHDCVKAGIDVINYDTLQTQPSNIQIDYNVIYRTNVGIMILDAQTISATGNTLYQGTGANSFAYGIWTLDTNVSNLSFRNNIIAGAWTHPIQVRTSKAIWTVCDYNDIVPSAGGEVMFQAGTSVSQTLAQLQALGLMTHGITADPLLVAPPTNLSLGAGSPARGTGVNLGPTYQQALLPSTIWPTQVNLGVQAALWNMGAYLDAPSGSGGSPAGSQFKIGSQDAIVVG